MNKIQHIHNLIAERFGVPPTPHLTDSKDKIQPQASLRQYCRYFAITYLKWDIERVAKHGKTTVGHVKNSLTAVERMIAKPRWDKPIEKLISKLDQDVREKITQSKDIQE